MFAQDGAEVTTAFVSLNTCNKRVRCSVDNPIQLHNKYRQAN